MTPTSSSQLNDAQHNARLDRDGYVIVRLAEPGWIDDLRQVIEYLLPPERPSFFGPHRGDDPDLRRRFHTALLNGCSAQVLRLFADHRIFWASVLNKDPDPASALDLHQDWTFVAEPFERSALVWVPLIDVDQMNGTLLVVPGSHRRGPDLRGSQPWPDTLTEIRADLVTSPRTRPLQVTKGQAVVYDNALVHGSTSNLSGSGRPVAAFAVAPRRARLCHATVLNGDPVVASVDDRFFLSQDLTDPLGGPGVLGIRAAPAPEPMGPALFSAQDPSS